MPKFFRCILLILSLMAAIAASAQHSIQTFVDDEPKPDTYIKSVIREGGFAYLGGNSSSTCNPVPYVSKVDLQTGEVVWNTSQKFNVTYGDAFATYYYSIFTLALIGNHVYAINNGGELWQLDKNTGDLKWKTTLPSLYIQSVHDYSPTQILVARTYSVILINKQTGTIEAEYNLDLHDQFIGMGINGEILVGQWNRFRKVTNLDFAYTELVVDIPQPVNETYCEVEELDRAQPIDADNTLVFGIRRCGGGKVWLINQSTQQIIWESSIAAGADYSIREFKIQSGYLFCTWANRYYGGLLVQFVTTKTSMATGETLWRSAKSFTFDYPDQPGNEKEGEGNAVSIDVDSFGDVYLCGYANTQLAPGDMGIMKLLGQTGEKVFEKIITTNDIDLDHFSNGVAAMVLNDQPYFFGNVVERAAPPNGPVGNLATWVHLNPASGVVAEQKNYFGNRVQSSAVVQLIPYKNGHLLSLEKRGRYTVMTRLDVHDNVVWRKKLKNELSQSNNPYKCAVTQNGDIAILTGSDLIGLNRDGSVQTGPPTAFVLDSLGNLLNTIEFVGYVNTSDLYADQNYFYAALAEYGTNFYKFNRNGIQNQTQFNFYLSESPSKAKKLVEVTGGDLLLVGTELSSILINKNTLQGQAATFTHENGDFINYANDLLMLHDTLYIAGYNERDCCLPFSSLKAWSFSSQKYIWRQTTSQMNHGYYYKIIEGDNGYLYTFGKGAYYGFSLRKISRKTGTIAWEYTGSQWIYGADLFYDALRNQVVLTGSYNDVNHPPSSWLTLILDSNSGVVTYDQNPNYPGTGMTIGQASNGNILIGGSYSINGECTVRLVSMQYTTSSLPPNKLTASDGLAKKIRLSWTNINPPEYYQLFRNVTNNAGTAQVLTPWLSVNHFDDTTTTAGTTYYYFVRIAKDVSGNGASTLSNPASGYEGIAAPVVVAGKGTSLTQIDLNWSNPEGAQFFQVYRADTNDTTLLLPITGWISSMTYSDAAALAGKNYYYAVKVSASNTGTNPSFLSQRSIGYTGIEPPAIQASDGVSAMSVNLNWTQPSGAVFFKAFRGTSNNASLSASVSPWTMGTLFADNSAIPGNEYYYFVKTCNDTTKNQFSNYSNSDSGYRLLNAPVFVTVSSGTFSDHVEIEWNKPYGALFFQVLRAEANDTTLAQPVSAWISELQFSDTVVLPNTNYYYFVKASAYSTGLDPSHYSLNGVGFARQATITAVKSPPDDLQVYPNPSDGILLVNFASQDATHFFLRDIVGGKEEELISVGGRIDIRNYPAGVYIFKIVTPHHVQLIKVIKE